MQPVSWLYCDARCGQACALRWWTVATSPRTYPRTPNPTARKERVGLMHDVVPATVSAGHTLSAKAFVSADDPEAFASEKAAE